MQKFSFKEKLVKYTFTYKDEYKNIKKTCYVLVTLGYALTLKNKLHALNNDYVHTKNGATNFRAASLLEVIKFKLGVL